MIERRLKNIEESNAHLNAEKKIRMALFHEDDCDAHRYALGIVHRHLGENYESLKQYPEALREYRVFYYHMAVLSEQPRYRQAYYVALEKLGNVHKHFNDPHHLIQAIDCYEKVYHFVEKMHNDRSLVTILQKLAFTYLKAGHLEEAMQLYEKQEKLLEGLITSDESYLEDYASCLNYKGMILKKNDPEKARELFEKVIALRQDEASTPYHFFRLGNTYRLLGEVTQNKDYYLAAIHCFENSQLKSSEPYRKACLEALKGLE
jgi:tetratricopeptide (TPR) repeat protein